MESLAVIGASGASPVLAACACLAVVGFEFPHRVAGLRPGSVGIRDGLRGAGRLAVRCMPELLGLTGCLMLALMLRMRGDVDVVADPVVKQVWEEIKQEWPILMGGDTLLNFQTWLRLIVLMFVAARAEAAELPLSGLAAVMALAAVAARTALAARSRDYLLEGPLALGGDLPTACEVAMLPRLAWLSAGALRSSPVAASIMVSVTTWFASHHYLNLARNPSVDQLFTIAHALETVGAIAYLVNAICAYWSPKATGGSGAASAFMHLVMPFQAALAAYYFLTAIEPSPNVVGSGRPFCLLCMGNLLQLGLYLCASALHLARCFDEEVPSGEEVPSAEGAEVEEEPTEEPTEEPREEAVLEDAPSPETSAPVQAAVPTRFAH